MRYNVLNFHIQFLILVALMFLPPACSDSSGPQPHPAIPAEAGLYRNRSSCLPARPTSLRFIQSKDLLFLPSRPKRMPNQNPFSYLSTVDQGQPRTDGLLSLNTAPMTSDLLQYLKNEHEPVFQNPYS